MNAWAAACGLLDDGLADAVSLACVFVGVAVVAAIGVGFAVLSRARRARAGGPVDDWGLAEVWRLSHPRRGPAPDRAPLRAAPTSADRTREASSIGAGR